MKSVMLNGVEVKVGSLVRFVNDANLYDIGPISETIIKPVLYGFYVVRGFAYNGSFLLEGINNKSYVFPEGKHEPGFNPKRFEPVTIMNHTVVENKNEKVVKIRIKKEIIEKLDLESVPCN